MTWTHPTGKVPEKVILVSLGETKAQYIQRMTAHGPGALGDEVWTLNTGIRWVQHDLAFVMDDMQYFTEMFPEYGADMEASKVPIITSAVYDNFPTAVAYPLKEILGEFGIENAYFNNSVPYIIAYALMIGVKEIEIYGCDYTHIGSNAVEEGRSCLEFWLGMARAKGMKVMVAGDSTLLGTNKWPIFYGYLRPPVIKAVSGEEIEEADKVEASNIEPIHPYQETAQS